MTQYDRIRVPRGSLAATTVMVVISWTPLAVGFGGGTAAPWVQTAIYVLLLALSVVYPRGKVQLVRSLQRWILNPAIRGLFALGLNPLGLAILETRGRKSGLRRRVPVGNGRCGNYFWVIAEHGLHANYVRNIIADPRVRVRLRVGWHYRWLEGIAQVRPHDDPLARQRSMIAWHPLRAFNALNVRTMGVDLVCVHIRLTLNDSSSPSRRSDSGGNTKFAELRR